MIIPSRRRALDAGLAASMLVLGAAAAVYYARLDLTLSHYDTRGHLIVARRIFDNLTPGWWQIGAIWLPLPHLLNALPVQIDAFYRNGFSAVAISIVSFAMAGAAIGRIVFTLTRSAAAAAAGALVLALNPNVLYLQATPMTEPLLLGLMLLAVSLLVDWAAAAAGRNQIEVVPDPPTARRIGIVFALACLTRYEAWPVTATALALAAWVEWRVGLSGHGRSTVLRMAAWPAGAIAGFMLMSRILVGEWFVASGFYVPDNPARGAPIQVLESIAEGLVDLSGSRLTWLGATGVGLLLVAAIAAPRRSYWIVPASLVTTAALPFSAFFAGHPHRIRYMIPLVAAQAVGVGVLAGAWRRMSWAAALVAAGVAVAELNPIDSQAPMVVEAQWDRPSAAARAAVTDCLRREWDGEVILASMGSLGHYMQELSHAGLDVRHFIHEGTGDLWRRAVVHARPFAGWVLISEREDNRDALADPRSERPAFLEGFERVCEGGLVALYRRVS